MSSRFAWMNMIMPFYFFVFMTMDGFIVTVNMGMVMGMCVFVRMDQIAMTVRMGVDMGMLVGVLQGNGIFDH